MWIGAVTLVGGLLGLRRGWRRQAADAGGCAVALGLACWQYPRIVPYVQMVWPALSPSTPLRINRVAGKGPAVQQVALVYLFAALYGLLHILVSLYVPDGQGPRARRWVSGLVGAARSGTLALLALVFLPQM
jgi:uncharacterized membrane protein required for colicin V production